ncbi:MAG: hypothetical protein E7Z67_02545 [Thermoplasmata archaeon]|nr:hypothetical protein [Thermoplasmata archaeon]
MTGMQRDLRVGTFAVFVTACMLLCVLSPAIISSNDDGLSAASGDDEFVYVALGDSMSNGFGLAEYFLDNGDGYAPNVDGMDDNRKGFMMDTVGTYPYMLKQYLESRFDNVSDDPFMLAVSGMRTPELRSMLYDDFSDTYHVDFKAGKNLDLIEDAIAALDTVGYETTYQGMREYFQDRIKEADFITYNYFYDFGLVLSKTIMEFIGLDEKKALPFESYLSQDQIDKMDSYIESIFTEILDMIEEESPLDVDYEPIIDFARSIAEAVLYIVISYCDNFDANIGWMLANNPDVHIAVIDTYNTFGDMDLVYENITVPLGKIYGLILEITNGYTKHFSQYSDDVYHVDIYDEIPLFATEFRDVDLNDIHLDDNTKRSAVYATLLWEKEELKNTPYKDLVEIYDEYDANNGLTTFLHAIFNSSEFDYDTFMSGSIEGDFDDLEANAAAVLELIHNGATVQYDDVAGTVKVDDMEFSKAQLSLMWVSLFLLNAEALMCHPSNEGHVQIYDAIINGKDSTYIRKGSTQYVSANFVSDLLDSQVRLMDIVDLLGGTESDGMVEFDDGCANDLINRVKNNNVIVIEVDSGNPYQVIKGLFADLDPEGSKYSRYTDLLGEDLTGYLGDLRTNIGPVVKELLTSMEMGNMSEMAMNLVDSIVYTYMSTVISTFEVVDLVKDLNEDATILFVGAFNPFEGTTLNIGGDIPSIPLGEYYGILVTAINVLLREYCDAIEDVVYVDVSDMASRIETKNLNVLTIAGIFNEEGKDSKLRPDTEYIKLKVNEVLTKDLKAVGGDNDEDESETNWLLIGGGAGVAVVAIAGLAIFFRMRK